VRFALLGLAVALGGFGIVATLGTLTLAWPIRRLLRTGRIAAGTALVLRSAPAVLAAALTLGVVVPGYVAFEPAAAEAPGVPLLALAVLGAALLAIGLVRVVAAVRATRAFRARWAGADRVSVTGCPLPALVSSHPFPVVAAIGVFRPRLLVARQVVEALTPAELAAAAQHEMAHVAARDNLKALLLRGLPDPLAHTARGRRLEAAWREAAEVDADAAVGRPGSPAALELASALLKVARLAGPAGLPLPTPALHDGAPLARRVRTLAGTADAIDPGSRLPLAAAALLAAIPMVVLASPAALKAVHDLLETIVRTLR
jgi:beta-lactamase regulating signal transducer with metallopeptidase domain